MADTLLDKPEAAAPVASAVKAPAPAPAPAQAPAGVKAPTEEKKLVVRDDSGKAEAAKTEAAEPKEPAPAEKPAEVASEEKPEESKKDAIAKEKEKEAEPEPEPEPEAEGDTTIAAETPNAARGKNRRKSTGDTKGKTLSKKGSKARLTHIDAQPGDHFLVKLKGFPSWPAIICDESMLPHALVSSRPVSAARPDGTYAEAYADGGKRVHDRSFPVMYLYTNEFGWVANTALTELSAEKAENAIAEKMRKDLRAAFELAIEQHSVDHYKGILQSFEEELIAQEEARKEAAATPKKKKSKAAKVSNEYDDVDMADVDEVVKPKPKKRKAEEDVSTPQRSDSVKKPKIKLNTSSNTPKAANGTSITKGKDGAASKTAKAKTKKSKEAGDKKSEVPKEAKMTPEERHARKEKEVLYIRHKLQRGLLTREQQPREDEMNSMSEYIDILENLIDLEGSIIRITKINKVLKAILKLDSIPHEEEYNFKKRSQALLDKWNKLLASDGAAAPAGAAGAAATATATAAANGVSGSPDVTAVEKEKEQQQEKEKQGGANGAKDDDKTEVEKTSGDVAASTQAKPEDEKPKDVKESGAGNEKVDEEMASGAPEPSEEVAA